MVHCDYFADLRRSLAAQLVADGFAVNPTDDAEAVLLKHLNIQQRRIGERVRTVAWSRELGAREPTLSPKHRAVIGTIERASVKGENLNPYLSRRLVRDKDADFADSMDNDWGMKHMHLNDIEESPGVIRGVNDLLFVIARDETLYLIDVGVHGDWAKQRLFEIVESNWPDLFAHALLQGVTGDSFSEEARLVLRKKFSMGTTTSSGNVYVAPGGGQMANGLNMEIRIAADAILNRLSALEKAHKAQGDEIAASIRHKTGKQLSEVHLQLCEVAGNSEVTVRETQTNIVIKSSMAVACGRCPSAVQATREEIVRVGWALDASDGWVCPKCSRSK